MLRFFKIFAALVALLITLSIVAVIVVLNIDPNNHKDWITEQFEEQTGRQLTLGGEIELSFHPWLGIRLEDVAVGDDPAFSNESFFSTERAQLRIKLFPLLRGEFEIDTVILHNTWLHLIVDEAGRANWESLVDSDTSQPEETETEQLEDVGEIPRIIIGGVDIRNLNLIYEDRLTPNRYAVEGLDFTIPALTLGEEIPMNLQAQISAADPELQGTVQLDALLDYASDGMSWTLGPLNLQVALNGPTVPGGSAVATLNTHASVDFNEQHLTIPELSIDAFGFSLLAQANGEQIDSDDARFSAQVEANSDDLSTLIGIFDPEMGERIAATSSRSINIQARTSIDLGTQQLEVPELLVDVFGFNLQAQASGELITSDDARFSGQLNADSNDLSTLVGIFDPEMGERISAMASPSINIQARTAIDLGEQQLEAPELLVNVFGFNLQAQASGEQITSDDARFTGQLNANSDDLSTLVSLFEPDMAERIATMDSRGINLQARGSFDLGEQHLELPELMIDAFGFNLQAQGSGEQVDSEEARFSGQVNANSDDLSTLVRLFEPEIAQRIATMSSRGARVEARFDATPAMGVVDIPVLDVEALGLSFSAEAASSGDADNSSFTGTLQLAAFSPRQFLQQLGIPLPEMANPEVLNHLALEGQFSGDQQQVSIDSLLIALDDTRIDTRLGYMIDSSAVDFTVNVDTINLDHYLPPETEEEPVTSEPAADTELPLETMRELQLEGVVNIGHLVAAGLTLEETQVAITARNGLITVSPATSLYSGTYSGELALDVREDTPSIRIDSDLSGIDLGVLTQDAMDINFLRGNGNVHFSLQGRGLDPDALRQSLQGNGSLQLSEGRLYGIDIAALLEQVEAMIEEGRQLEIRRGEFTTFNDFSGSFLIDRGVITTEDLLLAAPGFQVQGMGTLLDLPNETFDFNLSASEAPETADNEQQRFDLDGYTIPISCSGSVSSPRCVPNLEQIIREALGREVQRRFGDLLQRALERD